MVLRSRLIPFDASCQDASDDRIRIFGPNKNAPGLQVKSIIGIGYVKPLAIKKTIAKSKMVAAAGSSSGATSNK